MIKFNVITLFPDLIQPHLLHLPFKKAIEKNLVEVNLVDLKKFSINNYGSVDDKTYGGGTGMILRIEPIYNALKEIKQKTNRPKTTNGNFENNKQSENISQYKQPNEKIVLLSPKGQKFTQKMANDWQNLESITFINGRYEGVDARVETLATDIISIGDYVLSGGELASLVIMESITRLLPGILEKEDAAMYESFSNDTYEYPQYTRPEEFNGLRVPEILLSGDHKKIAEWRKKNSTKIISQK